MRSVEPQPDPTTEGAAGDALAPATPGAALWWAAAGAGVLLAAAHFVLVFLWLLPGGPPGPRALAERYVAPLFAQNWWLFAPDPPAVARAVEVRGIATAGGAAATTAWQPVTAPLAAAVARNRLSPANARWILVLNATYALTEPGGPLRLRGDARELVLRGWSEPRRQPAALVVLERAGALALAAAHPGQPFDRLQVRITVRPLGATAAGGDELRFPPVPFPADLAGAGR